MPAIILENIRSAYNVWNIIRTCDVFWFDAIISGYTPSPFIKQKVKKTSLWAEESIDIYEFWDIEDALKFSKEKYWLVVAAEISDFSENLENIWKFIGNQKDICIVFGNEISWVMQETLDFVDKVFHIPMVGKKESLNVWQSSAIFMREIFKNL